MKLTTSLVMLTSCISSTLAQQPPAITSAASVPTATLESTNPKTLESLGYNPAQASFYASAIQQPNVKSAYEALDGEGAIDQLNGATMASDYNSILAAAVASLPADLQAPATSFFDGLRALGSSSSTAAASGVAPAGQTSVAASPSARGTQTGSLLLDTTGTPSMALATGAVASGAAADGGSSGGVTTTITVNTATGAPSAAGAQAMARPTGWVAVGAVLVGIAGVAVGV